MSALALLAKTLMLTVVFMGLWIIFSTAFAVATVVKLWACAFETLRWKRGS